MHRWENSPSDAFFLCICACSQGILEFSYHILSVCRSSTISRWSGSRGSSQRAYLLNCLLDFALGRIIFKSFFFFRWKRPQDNAAMKRWRRSSNTDSILHCEWAQCGFLWILKVMPVQRGRSRQETHGFVSSLPGFRIVCWLFYQLRCWRHAEGID